MKHVIAAVIREKKKNTLENHIGKPEGWVLNWEE